MADLGLAIAGVASVAAGLAKQLSDIYHSARDSYRDAETLANHLRLLDSILQELEKTFTKTESIWSDHAKATTSELLDACQAIFDKLNNVLKHYRTEPSGSSMTSIANRFIWHFKKDDVRSLTAQLESIKSTLQLMISVELVGDKINRDEGSTAALHAHLYMAGELVAAERASLANLLLVEEQIAMTKATTDVEDKSPMTCSNPSYREGRLFEWLNKVVGLSQDGGFPSDVESRLSSRSAVLLTDEQRTTAGSACGDVEFLLEKWTSINGSQWKESDSSPESGRVTRMSIRRRRSIVSASLPPLDRTNTAPNATSSLSKEDEQLPNMLYPITNEGASSDEGGTVQDFTEEATPPSRLPYMAYAESAGPSVLEDWLVDQAIDAEDPTIRTNLQGKINDISHRRGPFSEISILESQAPSVISSISSMGSSSDPNRVKKCVKMGKNLFRLRKYAEALTLYRDAYQEKKDLGEEDVEMLDIEFQLGVIFGELNKYPQAEKLLRRVLRKQAGPKMQVTEHYLGRVLSRQRKWKEAFAVYTTLWQIRNVDLSDLNSDAPTISLALRTGCEYGNVLLEIEMYEEALIIFKIIYPIAKAQLGPTDMKVTLWTGLDFARSYLGTKDFALARQILDEIYETILDNDGSRSPFLTYCIHEKAMVACQEAKFDEAEALARRNLQRRQNIYGKESANTLESAYRLSIILQKSEKLVDARPMLEKYHTVCKRSLGQEHSLTLKFAISLAEVLEAENELDAAESVLSVTYRSLSSYEDVSKLEKLSVAIPLGQLMVRNISRSELVLKPAVKQRRSFDAAKVYGFIYPAQKQCSGARSEDTLETGHQYGTLCLDAKEYKRAEVILKEVWDSRITVFGDTDSRSIDSGMSLGKAYLWQNRHDEAFQTLEPLFNTSGALESLSQSAQNIDCAELLGFLELSRSDEWDQAGHGWQLVETALHARKQLCGPVAKTFSAAMQVGMLQFGSGNLEKASEHFNWVFTEALALPDGAQENTIKFMRLISGLNSSVLSFIRKERRAGNDMLARVIGSTIQDSGKYTNLTRSLSYTQAGLLFLQQERRKSIAVLWKNFEATKLQLGGNSLQTYVSGELLSLSMVFDSLVRTNAVSDAVDASIAKISTGSTEPLHISICLVVTVALAMAHMETLARPLFQWLHKTQKRKHGRFSHQALIVLAIMKAMRIRKMYQKVKGYQKSELTFMEIGEKISSTSFMWNPLMKRVTKAVSKSWQTPGGNNFVRRIAKGFARATLWGEMEAQLAALEIVQMMHIQPNLGVGADILGNLRQTPSSFEVGRAETIYSDSSSESDEDHDLDDSDSIFGGFLGDVDQAPLRSLGASLIDLSAPVDEDVDRAMENILHLQDDLLKEVVSENDIANARENVEQLEEEAERL